MVAPKLPPATAVAEFRTTVLSATRPPVKALVPPRISLPEPAWVSVPAPVTEPLMVTSLVPAAMVRLAKPSTTLMDLAMVPETDAPSCRVAEVVPLGRLTLAPEPRAAELPRTTVPPRRSVSPA